MVIKNNWSKLFLQQNNLAVAEVFKNLIRIFFAEASVCNPGTSTWRRYLFWRLPSKCKTEPSSLVHFLLRSNSNGLTFSRLAGSTTHACCLRWPSVRGVASNFYSFVWQRDQNNLLQLESSLLPVLSNWQRDQIWQNFATWAKILKSLAMYWGFR